MNVELNSLFLPKCILMQKMILGDSIEEMKKIKDKSVDLIIADPPYWKVVNEKWDYQWKTEKEYLEWSLNWIREAPRILRYGGTFYLFGYFRTLALFVPKLEDLELELRQQILIDKGMQAVSGRATKNYKIFPNTTESVLMIIKDNKQFIKPYLKSYQEKQKLTSKEINEGLVEENHLPKSVLSQIQTDKNGKPKTSILEDEFLEKMDKLSQKFHVISREDEDTLETIFKKYI
jgi:DNA modification methylase